METLFLILLPLLGGVLFFQKGNSVKVTALIISIAVFALSAIVFSQYCTCNAERYIVNIPWIPSMGINFHIGIDGLALPMVMLTTFLVPLIILSTFRNEYSNASLFYFLILLMEAALVGVFIARDAFLFYIFWELALIPIYFIALMWGGQDRRRITFKFFIYTLFGSLFMLIAIIYLYLQNPSGSFDMMQFYQTGKLLDPVDQTLVFWAFFLAFAIKMPLFPFHTWQPDTYTDSPAAGTMLLSGIMLKMGIFGAIRWLIPVVPYAVQKYGMLVIILSVIGIIYASIIAIRQRDIKRMIAYVSIAHVGLIGAGIFTGTEEGIQGAMIQMLSHGINVVGLFFIIDIIFNRTKTHAMDSLGGIRNVAPFFATAFMIILLGSVALPLTSGFIGEFMLIASLFKYHYYIAAAAGLTIILGAVYMLNSYQKVMLGETNTLTASFSDLYLSEKLVLIPIIIMIIVLGVYPNAFLDISAPFVKEIVNAAGTAYTLK